MKTLVLSDIHSNIFALEAIWKYESDSDWIVCAGDLVDYGPYPCEVLAWVREKQVCCVQGNHDAWLVMNARQGNTLDTAPLAERAWVHHNAGLLDEAALQFLEKLPQTVTFALDGVLYGMTHRVHDYDEIVSLHAYDTFCRERFAVTPPEELPRLILGHTHRQAVRYLADERLWLNPGSVSYRRRDDPDQTAHYATITGGKISLKRVDYDRSRLWAAVQAARLNEAETQAAQFFFAPRGGVDGQSAEGRNGYGQ